MEIVFDPKKNAVNKRKHGISLSRADDFDFDTALFKVDDRDDYGETRFRAIGFLDARLYADLCGKRRRCQGNQPEKGD